MYIEIDVEAVPPRATLHEADDFKAFKVVIARAENAAVPVETLKQLAGDRASDPGWNEQLEGMLGYAKSKGWITDSGAIQAHIEWS